MKQTVDLMARLQVSRECLVLNTQRAARVMAKKYDDAFRPIGLTNGQFSLLMALNVPGGLSIGDLAKILIMDRTTITANLKPLERDNLVAIRVDAEDARARRVELTDDGRSKLGDAFVIWQRANAETIDKLGADEAKDVLYGLARISMM